tara:strand:- start:1291 stop:1416 length:126 start_codon:yes stop_codon:yes gene_type:complete
MTPIKFPSNGVDEGAVPDSLGVAGFICPPMTTMRKEIFNHG